MTRSGFAGSRIGGEGRRRPAPRWLVRASAIAAVACSVAPLVAGAQGLPSLSNLLEPATAHAPDAPDAPPTTDSDAIDRESVRTRLAAVSAERRAAAAARSAAGAAEDLQAAANVEALEAIEALLVQQLAVIDRLAQSPPAVPAAAAAASETVSVFALNDLYEAEFAAEQAKAIETESLEASRADLETARAQRQALEKLRRDASHALEAAPVGGTKQARDALDRAVLASRLAAERVALRTLEVRLGQQRLDTSRAADASDRTARIASLRARLAGDEASSAVGFAELTRRDAELRRTIEARERLRSTVELRLEAVTSRYARSADPSAALLVEVEALTARRDAIRQELDLLVSQTERLEAERELWLDWQRLLAGSVSRADSQQIASFARARREALAEADLRLQGGIADLQAGREAIDKRLPEATPGSRAASALIEQRTAFERVLERQRSESSALARERRLAGRVLEEVDDRFGRIDPFAEVVRGISAARDLWSYEVTVVDDSPITVGSMVIAVLLMSMGIWLSRRASSTLGRFAMSRFALDAGAANALQTLCFYVLLVGFGLLALRAVHFPLTAFTVLGGALAIGIGFGSQNVMNNFISGLILMLERPVRVHDLVEIDGDHGTIERIGARSTHIRATDGRNIIVPNSFFLESNVVNWTLSDELNRTSVAVGVSYGSPTRRVEELILQAVREEPEILPNPAPIILFDAFGDNALQFEVHFWIVARSPMASRRVASHVRFRIDDLFRENGLVIAFPQRDVHLDSLRPIEVRMMDRDDPDVRDGGGTSGSRGSHD